MANGVGKRLVDGVEDDPILVLQEFERELLACGAVALAERELAGLPVVFAWYRRRSGSG
jgi:hypothetical protein